MAEAENMKKIGRRRRKEGFEYRFSPFGIFEFLSFCGEGLGGGLMCVLTVTPLVKPDNFADDYSLIFILTVFFFLLGVWGGFLNQFRNIYGYKPGWKDQFFRDEFKTFLLSELKVLFSLEAFLFFLSALVKKSQYPTASYILAFISIAGYSAVKVLEKRCRKEKGTQTGSFLGDILGSS